jgi:uncharacterized protein involved in exopolysaccharide biosynthesis
MSNSDSLLSLLSIVKKWFKAIFIVCSLAVIGTVIFSLNMDNYYKSTTTFYAAHSDLAKPSPIGGFDVDIDYYGIDADVDRILSIANSQEVANTIIQEFDLATHYEIKTDTPKGKYKVVERFYKLYTAQRNKLDAIEIAVEDKNREMAMKIANRARDLVSDFAQRLIKQSQDLLISKYQDNIKLKEKELDSLIIRIEGEKSTYGIYDTQNQGQVLAEMLSNTQSSSIFINAKISNFERLGFQDSVSYYKALKTSISSQVNKINAQISKYNKGVSKVINLEQEQEEFGLQLSLDKERFKQLKSAKASSFSSIHLVEKAEVPLIKSRPKRSILVIASGLISLFFCLFAAVVAEKLRAINWKAL